jgi:hypothetical protein
MNIILSRQQQMVLEAFRIYKRLSIGQLGTIYTDHSSLKKCLIRLSDLHMIKVADIGVWEYCGPEGKPTAQNQTLLKTEKKEDCK